MLREGSMYKKLTFSTANGTQMKEIKQDVYELIRSNRFSSERILKRTQNVKHS